MINRQFIDKSSDIILIMPIFNRLFSHAVKEFYHHVVVYDAFNKSDSCWSLFLITTIFAKGSKFNADISALSLGNIRSNYVINKKDS